jgi:cytochrome c-type biogenesis protein CcmH
MTTSFFFLSAAIVLVALGLLAPTLLRRHRVTAEARQEYNVKVARDRLNDLQAEHERGELSDEEFEQARQDLDIALAQDLTVPSQEQALSDDGRTGALTLAALLLLVPAIVAVTYFNTGTPDALGTAGPAAPATETAAGHKGMPPIGELVKKLEDHLKQHPDNAEGWLLLGRTYMKLDRYDDAVRAYTKLNELQPDVSIAKISLADALSMQAGGRITDQALELLRQVQQRDAGNVTALWLLGNAAAQRGEDRQALDYWGKAYPLLAGKPQMQAELRSAIQGIEKRSGLSASISAPEKQPPFMGGKPAQRPAPGAQTANAGGPGLSIEVALDPELMDKASPQDIVFIYAKAASGPPMPLAVARKRVSDLPTEVELTDAMAMMPQMRLSNFPRVKVGARISKSGQAIPQSGDLQSREVETASDSKDRIQLLINSQRP